jgi:aminoglycoside phosphotransferase (APT) family kinase protein
VTVHTGIDWDVCVGGLMDASPRLGFWLQRAAAQTRSALAAAGAAELAVTVVHGDFAEWNVHYDHGRLAGVGDFGLTHLDSRPYELAIARTCRSPEVVVGYRDELARRGWRLSELEEAMIGHACQRRGRPSAFGMSVRPVGQQRRPRIHLPDRVQ